MKKLFTSIEFKRFNSRKSRRKLAKNTNYKKWKTNERKSNQGKSKEQILEERYLKSFENIRAPSSLSFLIYPNETIDFINKLDEKRKKRKKTFVNLKYVEFLDYTAVTALVSIMFSFRSRLIEFNGNFPKNEEMKKLLIEAQFFKYLKESIPDKIEYTIEKKNQIFTRANKKVNPELGLLVMKEASETIWEQPYTCKGLQRVLLELMQNTNNHADIQKGKSIGGYL